MEKENTSKKIKKEWGKRFNKISNDLDKIRQTVNQVSIDFDCLPTFSDTYDVRLHQLTESLRDSIQGSYLLANQMSYDLYNEKFIGEE